MVVSGEVAALLAAFLWSVSAVLFGGMAGRVSPLGLNLLKGLVAIVCLTITIGLTHDPLPPIAGSAILILLLSGAIGIGIGDTFYFGALHTIGSRKTLMMKALAPPSAAIGAMLLLQEWLTWQAWGGILLTIAGVTWVISERTPANEQQDFNRRGLILGFLAALTDAFGAVLSRIALTQTSIDPLWSALIRLVGGTIVVLGLLIFQQKRVFQGDQSLQRQTLLNVAAIAFFSTYLGIWLQQMALKATAAGIAQTLGATSPLFALGIAAIQGKHVTGRSILGATIAMTGIAILLGFR
jgi:drug/metabolite transporter (DMT)-like permease